MSGSEHNRDRPLLLLGGGQHATVAAEAAQAAGWQIVGFFDDDPKCPLAVRAGGLRHLGALADAASLLAAAARSPAVHAATGDPDRRRAWLEGAADWFAPPIVHPSAVVSPTAALAGGVLVGPLAVINAGASVGRGAIVNSGAIVEHDCILAPFCHVAPGAVLAGRVSVGAAALIGAGAVVNPSVRIGARTILGAGAVAVRDLPDGVTAVGVPARGVGAVNEPAGR